MRRFGPWKNSTQCPASAHKQINISQHATCLINFPNNILLHLIWGERKKLSAFQLSRVFYGPDDICAHYKLLKGCARWRSDRNARIRCWGFVIEHKRIKFQLRQRRLSIIFRSLRSSAQNRSDGNVFVISVSALYRDFPTIIAFDRAWHVSTVPASPSSIWFETREISTKTCKSCSNLLLRIPVVVSHRQPHVQHNS